MQKKGIDFQIGIGREQHSTMARIVFPTRTYVLREVLRDPRVLVILASRHLRLKSSLTLRMVPHWLRADSVGSLTIYFIY